jgi:hypothetical protein
VRGDDREDPPTTTVAGESVSAIARDRSLSRKTVKRALRLKVETFEYRRARQRKPKLGP